MKIYIDTIIMAAEILKQEYVQKRHYVKILPNADIEVSLSMEDKDYVIPYKEVTIRYDRGVMILEIPEEIQ